VRLIRLDEHDEIASIARVEENHTNGMEMDESLS